MTILQTIKEEDWAKQKNIAKPLSGNKEYRFEKEMDKIELIKQRERIEEKIKRAEKKYTDDRILTSLRKLEDVANSVSEIQSALNIVWKRVKQIEEELKEVLAKPALPSSP